MRNYVIINGVNSLTIPGLAIKSLPPITKPIQRTLREEIDGRDGDIITELGYGAYDKEIEIGLFGNFDVDQVIAYFNQKGTITFSNEPDKVYYFQALNQVDYEELIKFREAGVTLHCQPFKYPVTEEPLIEEYEYVTGSGETITLDNTEETTFNEIELKGNTSQDGTPTPTSPIPINVVSGDNEIQVCGKNLFDKDNANYVNGWIDGTTMRLNTINGNRMFYIPCKSNTTYTISRSVITSSFRTTTYDSTPFPTVTGSNVDYTVGSVLRDDNGTTLTITTGANAKYLIVHYGKIEDTNLTETLESIMIKYDSSASTYEPYQGNTYNIDLPEGMELCKIGNYQDYFYKDSGKWYLHKEIGKVVLNGSESGWHTSSLSVEGYKSYYVDSSVRINQDALGSKCNYFEYKTYNEWQNLLKATFIENTYQAIGIRVVETLAPTLADFKTWLSTHNTIAYFVLATPTNTEVEYQPLIDQLNELEKAMSKDGQTNISQVNNDLPFFMIVSALKLGSDVITIPDGGNIYSKPMIKLEGTGIVDIYLNDVQEFEVDLTEDNEITIDTEKMEAYTETGLANRKVTGDYSKFKLQPGDNELRFSGALTKATITRYTRWL